MFHNFEYCCGAAEVGNLHGNTATAIKDIIENGVSAAREQNKGAVICTTIAEQNLAIAALRSLRFKKVARFQNPNTGGTWVSVWFKRI
jgi:hypothetical protein